MQFEGVYYENRWSMGQVRRLPIFKAYSSNVNIMNKKVNTFVIGQPRCGTTSLYSYLKMSPDIFTRTKATLSFREGL